MKIALLQLLPEQTIEENLQKGLEFCRKAKQLGADIALFPEMWSIGYRIPKSRAELEAVAVTADSGFVTAFGAERVLTDGDDFYTADLNTEGGIVKVGAMICYDREFPESARILMLKGAEIILVPNACPMEMNRLSQLRARAYENMVGIATVNYPIGQPDCNGHSTAFDGIAYGLDESGSRDMLLVEAKESEGIYIADFPIEELRVYRSREVQGNAYRHPQKYGMLISESVEEPFIRHRK